MARGVLGPSLFFSLALASCGELRAGPADADGGADGASSGGGGLLPDGAPLADGSSGDGSSGGPDGATEGGGPETLAAAGARLAALRFPGPLTSQGSVLACTRAGIAWRDSDGTMHAWRYDTQKQLDYTFNAPRRQPFASDAIVAADTATYSDLLAYDATQPQTLLATLPYAFNYYADDTGIVRLDQRVNGAPLNGTMVRKWTAATGQTVDVSTVLSTPQPPGALANGKVVIPASVNAPFAVYVVDVAAMTTVSVTFDGGTSTYDYLPLPSGLLISYARTGSPSIRLYKGYSDASRVELGDEVKSIPPVFAGAPASEHTFIARIAASGSVLLYGSAFGIWGYDMVTGALTPIQLGDGTAFVADTMCTIDGARALVYRLIGDGTGQVWVLPLAKVLP